MPISEEIVSVFDIPSADNAVLETFDDVVDALTIGHHVQLVMDFRACGIDDELAELQLEQAVRTTNYLNVFIKYNSMDP